MGRTAQLKKTSEQRCREAFEAWANELEARMDGKQKATLAFAWQACWKYLEREVVKEFIEG